MSTNATSFEDLQALVLAVFKRTDKEDEIKQALNDTYKEMVGCVDPRKQKDQIYKSTVIGQEDYTIPDTILRINHPVRLIDTSGSNRSSMSYPLDFYPKDEYDRLEPNPNATTIITGRPYAYTFWKNALLLTNLPDKVYKLEMNVGGEATPMDGDADTTIFAPTWDEIIKAGALARLYAGIRFWDEVKIWQAIYRWGFAGNEGSITGGLELLKQLNDQIAEAPKIVRPNYF